MISRRGQGGEIERIEGRQRQEPNIERRNSFIPNWEK